MKKCRILITLLVLPYFTRMPWLVWLWRSAENKSQPNHGDRQRCRQLREASADLQEFYLNMPNIQETWMPTATQGVVLYSAYSQVSYDLLVNVTQALEVSADGTRPIGSPKYWREEILDEHKGFFAHSLKTKSSELTNEEFRKLYAKYRVTPKKVAAE